MFLYKIYFFNIYHCFLINYCVINIFMLQFLTGGFAVEKNNINRKEFMKLFLNDSYIKWLENFTVENDEFDDCYFVKNNNLSENDKLMIEHLKYLYYELLAYYVKVVDEQFNDLEFLGLSYKDSNYGLNYDGECFGLVRYRHYKPDFIVDYEVLKQRYNIEDKIAVNNIQTISLESLINKVSENPTEFYKKISAELTPEERLFIMNNLENKSCDNCTNCLCRIENYEKGGIDEFGNFEGSSCCGWYNDELVGRSKVLKKTDIYKLK